MNTLNELIEMNTAPVYIVLVIVLILWVLGVRALIKGRN